MGVHDYYSPENVKKRRDLEVKTLKKEILRKKKKKKKKKKLAKIAAKKKAQAEENDKAAEELLKMFMPDTEEPEPCYEWGNDQPSGASQSGNNGVSVQLSRGLGPLGARRVSNSGNESRRAAPPGAVIPGLDSGSSAGQNQSSAPEPKKSYTVGSSLMRPF